MTTVSSLVIRWCANSHAIAYTKTLKKQHKTFYRPLKSHIDQLKLLKSHWTYFNVKFWSKNILQSSKRKNGENQINVDS